MSWLNEMPPTNEFWINRSQWEFLLAQSKGIQDNIRHAERIGVGTERLWEQLRPINQTIRSPLLKVRGIDDRERRA